MDHPRPWLRLVDAGDLDDSPVDFDNLKVRNAAGDKLGTVDGFVVDRDSGRPYYVVVDAGGWFKSKHFLLPIGHARLDDDRDALVTDLDKERVNRFPGFSKGEFDKLSEDELRRMGDETSIACGYTDATVTVWERSTYRQPDWWQSEYYRGDSGGAGSTSARPSTASSAAAGKSFDERASREREAVTARGGDTSPHPGGRAQPGDVIGFETGGEKTHIGDTNEDENKRRRDAEEAVAKKHRD
jgi:hypothetical protein